MKLCYGDERARWGPAACSGWARASERERASLTGGRCNPAILPDTAHQNVLTTPAAPRASSRYHMTPVTTATDVASGMGLPGRVCYGCATHNIHLSWVRHP